MNKKNPCALITGISGQDGSYLAELLLRKNYKIVGITRNIETTEAKLPFELKSKIDLVSWDFIDQQKIIEILLDNHPDEIYNFAAYSSGAGMYDNPIDISKINGLSVTLILESIRLIDPNIRFCQASSSEMYGHVEDSPQSESTRFKPRSPYGAAKLYAHTMIEIYRQQYGLFACSAILFNHESPRRGLEFVTRKITHGAAMIKLGQEKELHLGNLEARRDWGYAGDYVYAMSLMASHTEADDYVIATEKTHSVRDFCKIAFNHLGLNYLDYIHVDKSIYRPPEPHQLVGSHNKAKYILGWVPKINFRELVCMMVDSDMQTLSKKYLK
jgi:GDPmannose 4,6-dehydratase